MGPVANAVSEKEAERWWLSLNRAERRRRMFAKNRLMTKKGYRRGVKIGGKK